MLLNNIGLLLRFETTSLLEEVSQTYITAFGTDTVVRIADGGGYKMQDDQYLFGDGILSNGYALNINDAMTMGFWLFPYNPGLVINAVDSAPTSIRMPLLDFTNTGDVSGEISIIEITEHTSLTGNNYLTISLDNGVYSASSEEYSPFSWHYFWITYSSTTLSIYVDGKINILQNPTGSYPGSLTGYSPSFGSFADLYINHSKSGYSDLIAKNKGIIDNIFVSNVVDNSVYSIQRAINDGVEFIVDDNYTILNIDKFGVYFNDPETITVTCLVNDMSYVFIGRNDGKILRGSPLLWEVRRTFSNLEEIKNLGVTELNGDGGVLEDDGFLTISDTTIRL